MNRHLILAVVLLVAALGIDIQIATAQSQVVVGCGPNQAIRSINLTRRTVECVNIETTQIAALQAAVTALQQKVNSFLAFVAVDPNPINGLAGPHVILTGANVHIRSGSGATDDTDDGNPQSVATSPLGLGNLIVGYNETRAGSLPGDRGGSHNVIIGAEHLYRSVGGLVAGITNTVTGAFATVSGGVLNTASGDFASVCGGNQNIASGIIASASGGLGNVASGVAASVSGGAANNASGDFSSVSGGSLRSAPGHSDWVAGSLFEDF